MWYGLFLGIRSAVPLMQAYHITSPFWLNKYVTVFPNACTKLPQFEVDVEAHAVASVDLEIVLNIALEAGDLHLDPVFAGREERDGVETIGAGGGI